MTRRRNPEPLLKVTLNVHTRDWDKLKVLYPQAGPSVALRQLLHAHVSRIEAKAAAQVDDNLVEDIEINLEELQDE